MVKIPHYGIQIFILQLLNYEYIFTMFSAFVKINTSFQKESSSSAAIPALQDQTFTTLGRLEEFSIVLLLLLFIAFI